MSRLMKSLAIALSLAGYVYAEGPPRPAQARPGPPASLPWSPWSLGGG